MSSGIASDGPRPPAPWSRRRPVSVAALLSFVWPGLGQLFQGRRRRAVVLAVPLLPIALGALILLADGLESAALRLFDPTLALVVLWVVVLAGVWRLLAIVEPVAAAGGPRRVRRLELGIVLALGALVVETHAIVGNFAWAFYQAGTAIFDPGPVGPRPDGTPDPSRGPVAGPFETPATAESRINVLLIGIDSAAHRTTSLTDTIIVASVDPTTGSTSMVSFPRDIAQFRMYDGGSYDGKINSLMTYAAENPGRFPDGPVPTLMREVGFLLGIPIHYYASVNLDGFVQLIDAMGHVTIDNQRAIDDPTYTGWSDRHVGFFLPAGIHNLDGETALAYARSRKGLGENDFTRAARQQELLLAVRRRVTDPAMLPRLPGILAAAARTLRTNFPEDRLDDMLVLARSVDDSSTRRVVLERPYAFHPPTNTTGGTYILRLRMERVKNLSIELYGSDSAYWTPGASAAPSPSP